MLYKEVFELNSLSEGKMDKQKEMIEEMAKVVVQGVVRIFNEPHRTNDYYENIAQELYEQGYRKIDKGSVVLTREEYENLKNQINSLRTELSKAVCSMYTEEEFEYKVDQKVKEELDQVEKEASKETAEKIYSFAMNFYDGSEQFELFLLKFREQFGVEIKE